MTLALLFALATASVTRAQDPPTTVREYHVLAGQPYELDSIATAGVTLNKAFTDLYIKGLEPLLPPGIEKPTRVVWSVFWTFNTAMWPHEFGHWARARDNGGDFIIEGYAFPFPTARMVQPPEGSVTPQQATLSSVGGHEINHLMLRLTEEEYYLRGYANPDQLIHSFISQVYYPFYVFVVANVRTKPGEPSTWTDTWGDPVESTLSVFESYTGRDPIRPDGTVDPELVSLYWETVLTSLGVAVLDPMTYQSARGFGGDLDYRTLRPWMLGDERLGWMYGLRFNQGSLGHEVYLVNYLRLNGKLAIVTLKGGRPYHNVGLTLQAPALVEHERVAIGLRGEVWDQEVYGTSAAAYATVDVPLTHGVGLLVHGGYKGEGYLVGQRLDAGPQVLAGLSYEFEVH